MKKPMTLNETTEMDAFELTPAEIEILRIKEEAADRIRAIRKVTKVDRVPNQIEEAIALLMKLKEDQKGVKTLAIKVKTNESGKNFINLKTALAVAE